MMLHELMNHSLACWPYMKLRFPKTPAEPLWSCELHLLEDREENKKSQFGQEGVDRNMQALGVAIAKRLATVPVDVGRSLLHCAITKQLPTFVLGSEQS